ncbi:hypothetical protein [Maribacter halichondriae]|uniref:hypothetical protein n=1 Tax=Maribacter halichondriae TaxID=2980554 RepID=UPI0023594BCB|nr:hypothetical protein [Maribacter sp. Hal144]
MKAFTKSKYGGPEVLQLEEVAKAIIKSDHILVEVKANSANPADWHILRGKPFLHDSRLACLNPRIKF